MNRYLILLCFLLFAFSSKGQNHIYISVIDSLYSTPLEFANISIGNSGRGTATNQNGVFVISKTDLPVRIRIVYVGYNLKEFILRQDSIPDFIIMSPLEFALREVVIRTGQVDQMVRKVFKRLSESQAKVLPAKSFFRLVSKSGSGYSELIESYFSSYLGTSGIRNWEFNQGRYAIDKRARENGMLISLDFSMIFRYLDLLNQNSQYLDLPVFPIRRKAENYFIFTITGWKRNMDGSEYALMRFLPKKSAAGAVFSGEMTIDTKSYEIVHIIAECRSLPTSFIHAANTAFSIDSSAIKVSVHFTQVKGKSVPASMNFDFDYSLHSTFGISNHIYTTASLVNYEYGAEFINYSNLPPDDEIWDYNEISSSLYLPDFWKNNEVLAATPLEDLIRTDFERKGSFGKAFNSYSDTEAVTAAGFLIWKEGNSFNPARIESEHSGNFSTDGLLITEFDPVNESIDSIAGLNSVIMFMWNCQGDSLCYRILPLFDISGSFISAKARTDSQLPFVLQSYFRLTYAYSCKLEYLVSAIDSPCLSRRKVRQVYNSVLSEFDKDRKNFLSEVWTENKLAEWERKIHEIESTYSK